MKIGYKKYLVVLTTVLLLITGCSGNKSGGKKDNKTLVVANGSDPVTFDIQATNDQSTTRIARQIYDTLIRQTNDLELVPALATSWENIGNDTYEFKLRDDVVFHNGEKFTANDVAFTLKRAADSPTIGHIVGSIDPAKIKVVDEHTIQIGTKEAFGPFLTHLAHPAAGILNEKAVTEAGEDYGNKVVVGTGPFKFVEWVAETKVVAEINSDYWGTPAKVDKIEFKTIKDPNVRLIELENGSVDIAYDISPPDIEKVRKNDNLVLLNTENLGTEYLGFNVSKDTPIKDKKVRQAIAHAVDVEAIINTIYLGVGDRLSGPINSLVFGFNDKLKPYEYNMDLAKKLLAEAGYPDGGFTLTLQVGDNSKERIAVAQVVQETLGKIGITVEIQQLEWSSFLSATAKGEADMFLLGWTTITTDSDYGLFPLFHSSQFGEGGNRTFYKNDEVDKLLEQGRFTSDEDKSKRLEYYQKAQEIIYDDAPWVFLQTRENVTGYNKRVKGFEHHPTGSYFLEGVSISE